MAALTTVNRTQVGAIFQQETSRLREEFGALNKFDIQAAVAAIDDWIVANQASFNAALPLPARTALTASQKAALFMLVVQRRYDTGA